MTALVLAMLVACSGAKAKPPTAPSERTTDEGTEGADGGMASATSSEDTPGEVAVALQGNEEGAHALLKQFIAPNADHAALTRSLRPTSADYKALFDEKLAEKVEAAQAKDWDSGQAVIKPKDNQTEIKVWGATGAELAQGTGNAKEFPAEYKKVAKHLAADVTFFRFKFVEAGKETGTAYDGLVFVNGHWVIAPKPWKALEGGKSGGVDGADEDAQLAHKKGEAKKGGKGGGKGGGKKGQSKGGRKK
jgi:hypothetical protein